MLRAVLADITVASQLGARLDALLAERCAGVTILPVERGIPSDVPEEAEVLFAAPVHGLADRHAIARPAGWPGRLRWIQLVSAGADGYPHWLFDGPAVSCARGPSAEPLAEYAMAAIFASAKHHHDLWVHDAASWTHRSLGSVAGCTLGIFGFGAVGRALATMAIALGMKVLACRATPTPIGMPGVERVQTIGELLARADHLVLAAPATAATQRIIDAASLARAKPGLHLVNVARGSLIDTDALVAALASGTLGRVTLDTCDPEPLPDCHPLYHHPRAFISAHTGMSTPDVLDRLADKLSGNLDRFRRGLRPTDIVDAGRGY